MFPRSDGYEEEEDDDDEEEEDKDDGVGSDMLIANGNDRCGSLVAVRVVLVVRIAIRCKAAVLAGGCVSWRKRTLFHVVGPGWKRLE